MLRTRRTLVLPAHVNITAVTNSYDVVHSWFIPGLGLKMDCIPGRATHHNFYVDNVGFYYGNNVLKFVVDTIIICLLEFVLYRSNIFYYGDILLVYQNYYLQVLKKDIVFIMVLENLDGNFIVWFLIV